jgi:hypothetical protein
LGLLYKKSQTKKYITTRPQVGFFVLRANLARKERSMSKRLNIEFITGLTPAELGITDASYFLLDGNGAIIGLATSDGSYDYSLKPDQSTPLTEIMNSQNESPIDEETPDSLSD